MAPAVSNSSRAKALCLPGGGNCFRVVGDRQAIPVRRARNGARHPGVGIGQPFVFADTLVIAANQDLMVPPHHSHQRVEITRDVMKKYEQHLRTQADGSA